MERTISGYVQLLNPTGGHVEVFLSVNGGSFIRTVNADELPPVIRLTSQQMFPTREIR